MNESQKQYLIELLTELDNYYTMRPARPNITVTDNGELSIGIIINKMWHSWVLDEEQEMSAKEYAQFIIEGMREALKDVV